MCDNESWKMMKILLFPQMLEGMMGFQYGHCDAACQSKSLPYLMMLRGWNHIELQCRSDDVSVV